MNELSSQAPVAEQQGRGLLLISLLLLGLVALLYLAAAGAAGLFLYSFW